jgi:hypothetical protein
MDRSMSFLSSGFLTQDHSPTGEKSRGMADLESNLSALGHVGIVKYQRDLLRNELKQLKVQTDQQKSSAVALRRLALRLAVQVSVKESSINRHADALSRSRLTQYVDGHQKDATIAQLQSSIHDYQSQGEDLLRLLKDSGVTPPSGKADGKGYCFIRGLTIPLQSILISNCRGCLVLFRLHHLPMTLDGHLSGSHLSSMLQ